MNDDLEHGGALDRLRHQFPDAPQPWLDLSTGINPWPYPHTDCPRSVFEHLPRQEDFAVCREAMAHAFNAPIDNLLIAPGSELLIRLLPTVLRLRSVAVLAPGYGDHGKAWRAAGAAVTDRASPLDRALDSGTDTDAVVLCNPNNPDGQLFDPDVLDALRARLARRGGWLIVDEAYADLKPALSCAPLAGSDGLIVLRSFGKFYGLAGLRLGALLAPSAILRAMAVRLGVWPVSGPALAIGARAYSDCAWQLQTRQQLPTAATALDAALRKAGHPACGGTALFRYLRCPDALALWERLARSGVYTRRFAWSREHLRIGLPDSDAALARLAAAFRV